MKKLFILPEELHRLAEGCGFKLYVVGGACRDFIAGLEPSDIDLCAPVTAERFIAVAQEAGFTVRQIYANTGTVKLTYGDNGYEFACFRTDDYVRGHAPERIHVTDDIEADARRRDFKCNAVYYDMVGGQFVDPLGGIADIKNGLITCVREAERVFSEDGLRLMRLCRLAAETGLYPSDDCLAAARGNAFRIDEISPERIWAELNAILHADKKHGIDGAQYTGLTLLKECGVLARVLPELQKGDKMEQRSDFHSHDVLEHSLRCVLYAPDNIRLAALLHDVGKPYCKENYGNFHGHEVVGAAISDDICARLKVPKAIALRTRRLIELHMYDINCLAKESKIRKLIVSNGDIWGDLLDIKQADFSACKDDLSEAPCVTKWRGIYNKMIKEGVPMNLKGLAVNGADLQGIGIRGAEIGAILQRLLADAATGSLPNEKNVMLRRAASLAKEVK